MPMLYYHVPPIGIGVNDGFTYRSDRPARHCKLCGASYQPELARSPNYDTDSEVHYIVQRQLAGWALKHNMTHSEKEHVQLLKSGRNLTPEAALKLIPLGIYPIEDLAFDQEVMQAGFEAPRCPTDDVNG